MFGKPSRRTRKNLEQHGRRATATVLAVGDRGMGITHGSGNVVANTEISVELTLRVEPQDEPAFEVQDHFRFPQLSIPTEGRRLAVIYNPDDHESVMLDDDLGSKIETVMQGHGKSSAQIDLMQQLIASATSGASTADTMAIASRFTEQSGAMVMASGGVGVGASPVPATPPQDPVELLSQLVALKDRGLVTETEFAQQKAWILGQ